MFASKDFLLTAGAGGPTYPVNNSLRFRSSASAYLNRTFGSPTNNAVWTVSMWVKRGALGTQTSLLGANAAGNYFSFTFLSDNTLRMNIANGTQGQLVTTQVFRDPSSWYHIVLAYDSPQATASNRVKIYVNGVQITSFSTATYPTQNLAPEWNQSARTGTIATAATEYLDCYMAEVNFIDGQALTPSSFGAYDAVTGVWQPALYTGIYGTNGFYLKFASTGSTAALGTDSSGNGNTWTVNNISITSGTTYDPMLDSPTLTGATVANHPVWNPVAGAASGSSYTISNGNLQAVLSSSTNVVEVPATMSLPTSGQYYWEITVVSTNTTFSYPTAIGISTQAGVGTAATFANNYYYYLSKSGNKYSNGTSTAYGATYTTNDVIGVAFDATAGTLTFYKNNTSQGTAYTGLTSGPYYPKIGSNDGCTVAINFGQRPFTYTPPSGYIALNVYNLSTPTIVNGASYTAATIYTGTGASQTVANTINTVNFQPDLVWVKSRSAATSHKLTDSVRGATKALISDTTGAETTDTNGVTAFGSTGFTVGSDATYNTNAATYVAWQWLAGAGSSSSNTNGSITSTVSVNATAGFSIVTYTGTGANATVGHGLGVAPSMIIAFYRGGVQNWAIYHQSLGATQWLQFTTSAALTASSVWNNTAPTSTVFSVGTASNTNNTGSQIAYCWSAVAGYSAFGSYVGNGNTDGPFVYTGFRPRFIMVKGTTNISDWYIWDSSRNTYNVAGNTLSPNTSGAEYSGGALLIDFLSNGFKLRDTVGSWNTSGVTYIYAAFAENPFKYALAR